MKASPASILFSVALLALSACQSNTYKISGTAEGLNEGDTLFFTTDLQTGEPSDTLILHDGKFTLQGQTDSVQLCMIYSDRHNELNAPFFLEPGNITLTLKEAPGATRIGGTTCNDQWQLLNDSVMVIGTEINRIAEHIYGDVDSEAEQQQGMEQIDRLNQRFAALVVKAAEKNISNEFGYFLLTYYPEELISNEQRARLIQQLPAKMQQRPAIKEMQAAIGKAAQTAEGNTISDFSQPQLDGTPLSIMSEVRQHKVTVIDFWASWCGPCRQEMPFMIEMYNRLKARGLGIVGISLDQEHDAWANATKQMNIPWPQMSDLKDWENAVAQQFSITSIPHTIVVDQQGKILRRGLRGEQLEKFLSEQLK